MGTNPAIGKKTITVVELTCQRCGFKWTPRKAVADVRMCSSCKSPYWDTPKTSKREEK